MGGEVICKAGTVGRIVNDRLDGNFRVKWNSVKKYHDHHDDHDIDYARANMSHLEILTPPVPL
jgi:hypothetical protein